MLLDSLFKLRNLSQNEDNQIEAAIDLACGPDSPPGGHPIFRGHFPGRPILPGACQVELVREVLNLALKKKYRMVRARNIKFLAVVDPAVHENLPRQQAGLTLFVQVKHKEDDLLVQAELRQAEDEICLKLNAVYR